MDAAKKANEEFIAKIAKTAGVKALPGGVYYKEVKAGTGATPKATQVCEVSYEGRLINGKVFDSSQDKTVKFPANQVIKGWTIALTKHEGGQRNGKFTSLGISLMVIKNKVLSLPTLLGFQNQTRECV